MEISLNGIRDAGIWPGESSVFQEEDCSSINQLQPPTK